jgi:CDP-paratose 2-epimerase
MDNLLITGGCGFVGSSLAIRFREQCPHARIVCLDNLRRRGSELNLARLRDQHIEFVHGDIRNPEDLDALGDIDVILECSAEPSVLAGYDSSPAYLINTNLCGTVHCLELARKHNADFIFLSTSRVYPIAYLNELSFHESDDRFELNEEQPFAGVSVLGIAENFPLTCARSLYGATKLASELLIQEYVEMYGLRAVINRCGVITGPWQFGKVDQGVVVLWAARHFWNQALAYIGFGGSGKQVRDILHVDDLFTLLSTQLSRIDQYTGETFNVGGGRECSVSLRELTALCETYTGNRIAIESVTDTRSADIPVYITDNTKVTQATDWQPEKTPAAIIHDIVEWITCHQNQLLPILK